MALILLGFWPKKYCKICQESQSLEIFERNVRRLVHLMEGAALLRFVEPERREREQCVFALNYLINQCGKRFVLSLGSIINIKDRWYKTNFK